MSAFVLILMGAVILWMLACAWCGYAKRFVLFLGVLLGGLALNQTWMMLGLDATFLEPNLILAQAAAVCYALSALGFGWLIGRIVRQWRSTRIEG